MGRFWRDFGNFLSFGALDKKDAKRISRSAQHREENAREELEIQRHNTQCSLEKLGAVKVEIYFSTIEEFTALFSTIGKIDLKPFKAVDESLNKSKFNLEVASMKRVSATSKELLLLGGGSAVTGAVAVGAAMGIAGLVGTASTGVAIGTLSGVAAQNATLAWLGGGALSASGAGVAGGMVVLGGIAIAPLAIFAMFLGANKGKQQLNAAREYSAQVNVIVEKIKTLIAELAQIRRGADLFTDTLLALNQVLTIQIDMMREVLDRLNKRSAFEKHLRDPIKKIFHFDILTEYEQVVIKDTFNVASLLRQLLETPLMDEQGAFLSEAVESLNHNQDRIQAVVEKTQELKLIS